MSNDIVTILESKRTALESVMPAGVDQERFFHIATGLVRGNTDLSRCEPRSVAMAIYGVARLGLVPDPALGHVYVIPYGQAATVVVGYRGYIELARRGGMVTTVQTEVVYDGCEFEYVKGTEKRLRHVPWYLTNNKQGKPRLVYCVAELAGGGTQEEVMTVAQIDAVKKSTKVWRDHWDEMARKTVVRRASKYWPLTTELATAVEYDEAADRGETPHVSTQLNDEDFPPADVAANDATLLEVIGKDEPADEQEA